MNTELELDEYLGDDDLPVVWLAKLKYSVDKQVDVYRCLVPDIEIVRMSKDGREITNTSGYIRIFTKTTKESGAKLVKVLRLGVHDLEVFDKEMPDNEILNAYGFVLKGWF